MTRIRSLGGAILVLVWIVQAVTLAAQTGFDRAAFDQPFKRQLQALAVRCAELELPAQAKITREWLITRDPGRQYLFLPTLDDPHAPRDNQPRLVRLWAEKFRGLRRQQAQRLFAAARQSLSAPDERRAFCLLHEVLREQPDHEDALRILGTTNTARPQRGRNRPPRARAGRTRHPQFGWRRGKYWKVNGPHFAITTSHSAKAGLELSRELEDMLIVWRQLFFDFWGVKSSLKSRFSGSKLPLTRPGASPRFEVVLFRDRAEYTSQLEQIEPQIARTVGYYLAPQKKSFFFAEDAPTATRFHEATHQFFQESRRGPQRVGEQSDFWMVEGIALYMESLERYRDYCTVGGFDADRLQFARQRLFNEQFYLPVGDLSGLGREPLQKHPQLRRLYSQSAGLVHFLMDGEGGRYRDGALSYLEAIYLGRADQQTLAASTATELDSLDQSYRQFLRVSDEQLQYLKPTDRVRSLCLAQTQTTADALLRLADYGQLEWLDLSYTGADDQLLALLKGPRMERLNLEGTSISDAALAHIGSFKNLRELDLSKTGIGDTGLAHLKTLSQLEVLYLTGTQITDRGLIQLAQLKQLEILDVAQTQVTAQALERLVKQLPRLESR
ncbi:MAG: hypothetical protein CMJ59_01325 [Planctomycetaceae bacterium]|nr:hypothetical protein [Planctomycetaceae bacterium]